MPASNVKQPMNLIVFVISITRLLGIASARAPTKAASATEKKTKNSLSSGVIQAGAAMSCNRAIAAINSALSASEEKNCAAMMVKSHSSSVQSVTESFSAKNFQYDATQNKKLLCMQRMRRARAEMAGAVSGVRCLEYPD